MTVTRLAGGVMDISPTLTGDDGYTLSQTGPKLETDYFAYTAPHESNLIDDPAGIDFSVFGATVNLAVDYRDDNNIVNFPATVKQMIGRSNGEVGAYSGTLPTLMRDWVGIDSRASQGGNGPLGNGSGSLTNMTFTLSGLPAWNYQYWAYHHDVAGIEDDNGGTHCFSIPG